MMSFIKKINWALFWPIWWSHLHYIVDFFQMYIILMSWMNSSWVFWKLSECKRPTWRQTLLRFSLKIFCLQDQWWSCKCRNFCAVNLETYRTVWILIKPLTHHYQIPYSKNFNVWTKLNNFLSNKIFVPILILFLLLRP